MAYCIDKYELYSKAFAYLDIENSKWYEDLIQGSICRYRNQNRIRVEFNTYQEALDCQKRAVNRNINTILYSAQPTENGRIDIMMNWKKRQPTRVDRKKELILT